MCVKVNKTKKVTERKVVWLSDFPSSPFSPVMTNLGVDSSAG